PRRLVHDPLRRTAPLHQRPGSPRFIAPQPQPHRVPARPKRPRRLPNPVLLRVTHQLEPELEPTPFHLPPEHATISGRVHRPSAVGPGQRPTPRGSSARSREPAPPSSPSTRRQRPHKPPPPPPHQPTSALLLNHRL